ncbi:MAG: hypothetical protein KH135_00500 [Firmicutes bacterium]|nr:hypothetical protein [Bacillota bacterium]
MENNKKLKNKWLLCQCCNKHFLFPAYPKNVTTKKELLNYMNEFIVFCSLSPDEEDMVNRIDFDNQFAYQFLGISKEPQVCPNCSKEQEKQNKIMSFRHYS